MDVSGDAALFLQTFLPLCALGIWYFIILNRFAHNKHCCHFVSSYTARRPGVMEVMHNLDYCDVLVIGEELNPESESLEIHHSALLGKHLDATNSTSGISIYGRQA